MSVALSVVVPLYNEEPNVDRLVATLSASLARGGPVGAYEILCVDDGSTDGTRAALERCRTREMRILSLPSNRGQSAALAHGLRAAAHPIVAFIDGDLQTTPDDLGPMVERLEQGYDCVHGMRVNRQDSFVRRISSAVANAVRRLVLHDRFRDIGCPLTVFRRECLDNVTLFTPFHRYLPFLIEMQGYRVTEMPVRHFPRVAGKAKYGIGNRWWIGIRSLLAVRRMARRMAMRRSGR
ncbi:MAG: glycosyltransferase family 2 protein [Gemmatimonadales bacterium]|jgi:glycosyltransferase involved in cell wall biosynthesis